MITIEAVVRHVAKEPHPYQMVEKEDLKGRTRIYLYISPVVGDISKKDVIDTVLNTLRQGADEKRMMSTIWKNAHTLQVKRKQPIFTGRGKLMPLHIEKNRIIINTKDSS